MYLKIISFYSVVILVLLLCEINGTENGALCPPQSLMIPCICNSTTREISCKGSDIAIDSVFERIARFLPESDRDFEALYLNARSVSRLEANQFKGIRFRQILLGGTKLTHIHRDAFRGTHLHVKELFAFATNLSISDDHNYNLFESISLLKNLQRLVISGSNIHTIPERAFKPRDERSIQTELTDIELGLGVSASITSVGSHAFASLPSLRTLSLSNQAITYISRKAFSFDEPSNKTLAIDLTGNHLNGNSFDSQAFIDANRPIKIYFGLSSGCNRNLTFLNQTVFEPFLNDNQLNTIDMGRGCGGHVLCDCRMRWIVAGNYEQQIKNLKCGDGGQPLIDSIARLDAQKCGSGVPGMAGVGQNPMFTGSSLKPRVVGNKSRSLTADEDEDNELETDYDYSELSRADMCLTDECYEISTEMNKYLNKTLNPCDNFYDYACGRWEDSHLLEYLVQLLSNGGKEYDNFISHSSFVLSQTILSDMNRKSLVKDIASYAKYIHDVSVLFGAPASVHPSDNKTITSAIEIIKFESEIAKISEKSMGKEFQLERQFKTLDCFIPEVNWTDIFANVLQNHNMSANALNDMNVIVDMHYMIRLSKLLRKTSPTVIANYLGWRVAETMGFLVGGPQFLDHQRTFHDIQSNERTKTLWKQCLKPLKTHLPYLLTREYAKKYLTQPERHRVYEIVKSVKQSFIELMEEKQWLDNKSEFINKVSTIRENVGYPDWLFDDNQFLAFHQNLQYLLVYFIRLFMTAKDRRIYINFGSIGSFVGHEISHASMPRYNADERLLYPWNDSNINVFLSKAKCFVDQYSAYFDQSSDMNLDGMKTFEEDIGDIAGLKASFNAFNNIIKQNLNKIYNDIKLLPNFSQYTPQQLFFLSYAQKWCRYIIPSQVRHKILRGVHSPEKYRVNGALSNFGHFSKAFDCPLGSNMNPEVKCEMW
ncbi:unnamed protein product [Medioppia subpectinata]|uniref:Uncharacterized protein n=1 Tax=Medioppia subpectinata TaxID=1979941 RepID=A0A7R9PZF0_9ACAR|nr:unnamed protein product [Medioppia subpectinata]CAG2106410.1 unnamed protein product [Medioppia subpectinata]